MNFETASYCIAVQGESITYEPTIRIPYRASLSLLTYLARGVSAVPNDGLVLAAAEDHVCCGTVDDRRDRVVVRHPVPLLRHAVRVLSDLVLVDASVDESDEESKQKCRICLASQQFAYLMLSSSYDSAVGTLGKYSTILGQN